MTATMGNVAVDAVAFVQEHLDEGNGEPLSVDDVSAHVGYSRFHFTRLFTAAMGIPPGRYLTAARIRRAKQLLLAGDETVADVCAAVGFTSLSTFTRQFRQAVGITPAGLRDLAVNLSESPTSPFALLPATAAVVDVSFRLPEAPLQGLRRQRLIWIGWFPTPAPIGLPHAGRLLLATDRVQLPLCPGAPWLLAFAVEQQADAYDVLAPQVPLVAGHPAPLTRPSALTLDFAWADATSVPLLPALPALRAV